MIEQKNTGLDISDSRDITESSASYLYSDASSWY